MKYYRYSVFIFLFINFYAHGGTIESAVQPSYFDTISFRLYSNETGFYLRNIETGLDYQIPKAMLTPPEDAESELELSDLIQFDSCVTAFPIGGNLLGIQLSSYKIWTGSMALAQGLDVFLTLDTVQKTVLPKVLQLGVTKQRSRHMGHFNALHTHFLLSQIGSGKYYSLGMYQEKIYSNISYDDSSVQGPFYEQTPIRWYVFDGEGWRYEASFDKRLPMGAGGELPLIGLTMTPVDYVRQLYKK